MINFKTIRWQNLLSTGNQFTEIKLNKSKSTLIVGENGAGKSTILDALSYALYGKPFRPINKPQLINSITGKNLLVEVEFSIGRKNYIIKRGVKPNIFEVYQDDTLINQNSSARDYQDYLEKTILKLSFKAFSQIVILGSANFVPFMQLPAWTRREVIEDLLDIQIFSTMNTLLKEKLQKNKNDITGMDHEISLIQNRIEMQKKHLNSLKINNSELIKTKQDLIDQLTIKTQQTEDDCCIINSAISELNAQISDSLAVTTKKIKLVNMESQLENKLKTFKKEIDFFHDNDNCPTCRQGIDHDFKTQRLQDRKKSADDINTALSTIETQVKSINIRISEISETNEQITGCNTQITNHNSDIRSWNNSIKTLEAELLSIRNNTKIIDDNTDEMDKLNKGLIAREKNKEQLLNDKQVYDVSAVMLKDTGIKTKIIRQYVPIMNKLINKYLATLEFFVQFELDDNFNEKIKSRFRDEFSYASFSEGEKIRIDLALMFTWRAIAKLRNSASTNLLILDEIFDSSLDVSGTDEFLKILEGLASDTNVFVISHKGDALYDKFHSVIKFEKNANFSRIAL